MKKSANVNEKKVKKESTKKIIDTPPVIDTPSQSYKVEDEDRTVRHLSEGDKSILDDLGITEKFQEMQRKAKEDNISYNRKYGFDIPFINEMMQNFNQHLNNEGTKFINEAEEALKKEDIDTSLNIHVKLILNNSKERILFKELLMTTDKYPILVTIGDYDFFFENFDDEQDPIFSFSKEAFIFFFSNDIEKLKVYLQKNKIQFAFKYNNISFDDLDIKIIEKTTESKKDETKQEVPVKDTPKEIKKEDNSIIIFKKAYKIKSIDLDDFIVVTDNPADIFNRFGVDSVLSVKLIGNGVCI